MAAIIANVIALDDLFTSGYRWHRARVTVILYRSDLLHAGPDNRSPYPRRFFGMSIARDIIEPKYWHDGYFAAPHLDRSSHELW